MLPSSHLDFFFCCCCCFMSPFNFPSSLYLFGESRDVRCFLILFSFIQLILIFSFPFFVFRLMDRQMLLTCLSLNSVLLCYYCHVLDSDYSLSLQGWDKGEPRRPQQTLSISIRLLAVYRRRHRRPHWYHEWPLQSARISWIDSCRSNACPREGRVCRQSVRQCVYNSFHNILYPYLIYSLIQTVTIGSNWKCFDFIFAK